MNNLRGSFSSLLLSFSEVVLRLTGVTANMPYLLRFPPLWPDLHLLSGAVKLQQTLKRGCFPAPRSLPLKHPPMLS